MVSCLTLSPICRHWSMSQMPDRLVGLRDAAVLEREREALGHAGLAQQPLGLGPAGVDVAPVAGELLQLGRRRGPRRPRHLDPADFLHHRDAGQVLRCLVAVERPA